MKNLKNSPLWQALSIQIGLLGVLYPLLNLNCFLCCAAVIIGLSIFVKFVSQYYNSSEPNEYMIVLSSAGQFSKAGIGMKCLLIPGQTAVKVQSAVTKLSFSAEQVTNEMVGLKVSGVAVWGVLRYDDGPLKYYQFVQGEDPNGKVKSLCESQIRQIVSNNSMRDVIKNRIKIRDQLKKQLNDSLKKWGVWLETIEIVDVLISSNQLFKDLQTDFRNKQKLVAEKVRNDSQYAVQQERESSQLIIAKQTGQKETSEQQFINEQEMIRQKDNSTFLTTKNQVDKERLQLEKKLELEQIQCDNEVQNQNKKNEQEIANLRLSQEMRLLKKQLEVEQCMNPNNLKKYIIDTTFENLSYRYTDVVINNYVGDENIAGMPTLALLTQQNKQILSQN